MWEEKETAELKWFNIQKKMKSYIELVPKEMSGDKSIDGELIDPLCQPPGAYLNAGKA